ncbi:MAG: ABC transporter permease [Gemmatimonadales bacterium]|nr:MAG: ABC transporter permease [Gemmatimonadales bacterium]
MAQLDWFLARRYLASRKKGQFLSFITWIALGGITVGVTALNVVLGVMNGMQTELRDKILESTPHVIVLQTGGALRMSDWRSVMDTVLTVPDVEAAAPFLLTQVAVLRTADYVQTADLYGVSLEGTPEDAVTEMEEAIRLGVLALERTESGLAPVVVGGRLATRMGILTGDTLTIASLENVGTNPFGLSTPFTMSFEVTGTFDTGMYEYDTKNMYAPLEEVQAILGLRASDQVSGLRVRVADPWEANAAGERILDRLGRGYFTDSWITQNAPLFAALQLEKLAMGIILFLIVIVASFNIVSTLVMVVVDRTSEIGILKSMGMTDRGVLRVFLLQGLSIGVLGTLLGTIFGLLLCWFLDRFQPISIPPDVYFIERLPVAVNPSDVLLILGGSVLIALLATIYPALQASRLEPVEAIKRE